ncbi:hypothetical protein BGZ54_001167 [Gamsiella multidivaricata]|nr:hypothetical protein BGZ54_001167 [Gamsiella multidivaricata]
MTTVAERLEEAYEHLLKLYTSIPILTPCLEKIKVNQAEFVSLNNRLRQLQENISAGQYKADKTRRQLDSVFTINKSESEKAYRHEINELKAVEDERRVCLRQRDSIVTIRYQLHKQRETLLQETRQLKKLTESVFDRSKDEVANADFPEELYWQLELKEYDFKITEVRSQVSKYSIALSNLARAANLSEAALMAFLGYPDAAYKVWRVEYALKASQNMKLYLRVELSLSNAYSNEDAAREACPTIVPPLTTPVKPLAAQVYLERAKRGKRVFEAEPQLRNYIAQLRAAHKTAELLLAQEMDRLHTMESYRESIIPLLAKIRRHVFQNSCLGGCKIEGWEDEQGQSLLGTEADILVRGGIHEIGIPTLTRPPLPNSLSSAQVVPMSRGSSEDGDEEAVNMRSWDPRGSGTVPETDEQESGGSDPNRSSLMLSAGRAPLSTLAPANMLGSEVLMEVDRDRQARQAKQVAEMEKGKLKARSRSHSGRDGELDAGPSMDTQQSQGSNGFSALGSLIMNNSNGYSEGTNGRQGEREGRKKTSRGLFGFGRSRRGSASGDASVPGGSTLPSVFQLKRQSVSSIDVTTTSTTSGAGNINSSSSGGGNNAQRGHHRNLPSISFSNHDADDNDDGQGHRRRTFFENASLVQLPSWSSGSNTTSETTSPQPSTPTSMVPSRPRVMSMDDYIGIGPVVRGSDSLGGLFDRTEGSAPLIPSYGEHQQHKVVDPEILHMITSSATYEGLSSLAEQDEDGSVGGSRQGQQREEEGLHMATGVPSRSLSPHSFTTHYQGLFGNSNDGSTSSSSNSGGMGPSVMRPWYQQHYYSLSDQTLDGDLLTRGVPPPDYAVNPPEYSA